MSKIDIPKITSQNQNELPDYEDKFGNLAEDIIRNAIGKKGVIVEAVEKGTKFEDYNQKVDFWLKIIGMKDPLGIQYTTDENKVEEKRRLLKSRNNLAKKEKRPDSEIDWEGNTNVIVIKGNFEKMLGYWKKIDQESAKPEDVVGSEFIRNFFSQVLTEIGTVNPAKKEILMDIFLKKAKEIKAKK